MKTVLLMFMLSSAGTGGDVSASYVEKDTLEECNQTITAVLQLLTEPEYKIPYAGCHYSTAKISEFEHPGIGEDVEEEEPKHQFTYLNTIKDDRLVITKTESLTSCEQQRTTPQSWCALSTQRVLD